MGNKFSPSSVFTSLDTKADNAEHTQITTKYQSCNRLPDTALRGPGQAPPALPQSQRRSQG